MRIWVVTVGEPLPMDRHHPRLLRSGVLTKELVKRGHHVTWWTSAFDHSKKHKRSGVDRVVDSDGVHIRMLSGVGYRRNISLSRLIDHEVVARKFRRYARALERPDVILASLPTIELAREASRFGVEAGLPVLIDVRDLWPDAIFQVAPARLQWLARSTLHWMTRQAREALQQATGIVGISEGYLAWALSLAGRKRSKTDAVIPLGYQAVDISVEDEQEAQAKLTRHGISGSKIICWYIGSFGKQYDLGPVIAAAGNLCRLGRIDVQFVISGEGEMGPRWRQQAMGLPNVIFTGWIDGPEISWLRKHAAIGLQPYVSTAPQGLANKLFEYISAGVPVLSSLEGENAALIAECRCGFSYGSGDAADFEKKLLALANSSQTRKEMGRNGLSAYQTQFSPQRINTGFCEYLESFATLHHGR